MNLACHFRKSTTAALITALSVVAVNAEAVPILPGQTVALGGTTAGAEPWLNGMVIIDTLRSFTITLSGTVYTGQIEDQVISENSTGLLDFYTRVYLNNQWLQAGGVIVSRSSFYGLTATGGPLVQTDVNWRIDGTGISVHSTALRTANGFWVEDTFNAIVLGPGPPQRDPLILHSHQRHDVQQLGLHHAACEWRHREGPRLRAGLTPIPYIRIKQ